MDASSIGFQSYMFWGLVPQVEVLKVGVLDPKPFAPQGEVGSCDFAPDHTLPCRTCSCGEIVSLPLLPILIWIFFLFL